MSPQSTVEKESKKIKTYNDYSDHLSVSLLSLNLLSLCDKRLSLSLFFTSVSASHAQHMPAIQKGIKYTHFNLFMDNNVYCSLYCSVMAHKL